MLLSERSINFILLFETEEHCSELTAQYGGLATENEST